MEIQEIKLENISTDQLEQRATMLFGLLKKLDSNNETIPGPLELAEVLQKEGDSVRDSEACVCWMEHKYQEGLPDRYQSGYLVR